MNPDTNTKTKILIVDDDKFLLDMYSLKFTKGGYEVSVAFNGEEAISKIKDGYTPDIILCDIIMPVMDGIKFLKLLREEKLVPNATVVVLSNQGQNEDVELAKSFNIDGYIIKALTIPSEVLEQVGTIHKAKKA
jgi:two-component system response regulator VicR